MQHFARIIWNPGFTWLSPALLLGTLSLLLFIHELPIAFLFIAQALLLIWFIRISIQSYKNGFQIPKSSVTLCLTLFWIWLGISIIWSKVPWISNIYFWWLGTLSLVFWVYTLAPDRARVWAYVSGLILLVGFTLASTAIYQFFFLDIEPKSIFVTRNTHAALLNIISLPASGYFLRITTSKNFSRTPEILLGGILFILFFSIALTTSRGAILSLLLGMGILLSVSYRHVHKRGTVALLILLSGSFFLANLAMQGGLSERMQAALNPANRLIIWKPAWEMLMASPWIGIGLGIYPLAWLPYKNPADTTAGFFVHNDYLQLWIEAGLPALILIILLMASVLWMLIRVLRISNGDYKIQIEATAIFSGLLALASHSFVDFNFYIPSILLISGLLLGRFHELACQQLRTRNIEFYPARSIRKSIYLLMVLLIVLLPMPYFAGLGISRILSEKALAQSKQGLLDGASKTLEIARRLAPYDDRLLISHANLFRHGIKQLPQSAVQTRKALYDDALRFLDEAEKINPLRWNVHVVRGMIYQQNPGLSGRNWRQRSYEAYRHALKLNPKLYKTRVEYAQLLLEEGKLEQAAKILDEGLKYSYVANDELIPFYILAIRVWRQLGEIEEAKMIEVKLIQLTKYLTSDQPQIGLYGY
ncbi:MAG: hypothetical protein BMS9Abin33_0429 [Gammaproteobacteria bacterium]|nr:MAG: hypothetical protein BMS9Abin33_0429 [Gammaproteobacteria bacterium]